MDLAKVGPSIPGTEIVRVEVGSRLHGLQLDGTDDIDLMGVTLEPWRAIYGLSPFESLTWRTADEGERSGPDDIDLVVYGLRKWMRLAIQGNANVLIVLFAPDEFIHHRTVVYDSLRTIRGTILSQAIKPRFLGYLNGQRQRVLKGRSIRGLSPGRENKWASHMLRLGFQLHELLETGTMTLPMRDAAREICLAVKRGEVGVEDALRLCEQLEDQIASVDSPLPLEPDCEAVERWLRLIYLQATDYLTGENA